MVEYHQYKITMQVLWTRKYKHYQFGVLSGKEMMSWIQECGPGDHTPSESVNFTGLVTLMPDLQPIKTLVIKAHRSTLLELAHRCYRCVPVMKKLFDACLVDS